MPINPHPQLAWKLSTGHKDIHKDIWLEVLHRHPSGQGAIGRRLCMCSSMFMVSSNLLTMANLMREGQT